MLIKIRNNTFETNSSSTHTIAIGTANDFAEWKAGTKYFDRYNEKFISTEEALTNIKANDKALVEYWALKADSDKILWLSKWHGTPADCLCVEDLKDFEREVIVSDYGYLTYKDWLDMYCYLDTTSGDFVTPGGEKVQYICAYGYEG